jgi:hypothetical protein
MKKLIATTMIALTLTSAAYAADEKAADKQTGMMKQCQSHMKDGKMMDSMPKDMMGKCQEIMKDSGMMKGGMMGDMKKSDETKTDAPKSADDADHEKHHPKQ